MEERQKQRIEKKYKTTNPVGDLAEAIHLLTNLSRKVDIQNSVFGGYVRKQTNEQNEKCKQFLKRMSGVDKSINGINGYLK
jgi:hypothetical protein